MELQEAQARRLYYSLDDINEFGRLLRVGQFAGSDYKSIGKADEFLRNIYKETLAQIEANSWYIEEKAAIQAVNIAEVMKDGSGEYNPDYKVQMADVFRKVVK